MPNSNELSQLAKTMNDFIIQSTKNTSTLEANQNNLNKAVQELSQSVQKNVDSNTRLEVKLTSLEDNAVNKIEELQEQTGRIFTTLKDHGEEITDLQKDKIAREAMVQTNEQHSRRFSDTFGRAIAVLTIVLAIFTTIYNVVSSNNKTTTETESANG
mgnify:CR=1 FL=1